MMPAIPESESHRTISNPLSSIRKGFSMPEESSRNIGHPYPLLRSTTEPTANILKRVTLTKDQ